MEVCDVGTIDSVAGESDIKEGSTINKWRKRSLHVKVTLKKSTCRKYNTQVKEVGYNFFILAKLLKL